MLSALHIENIAVIERAELLFEHGLHVLTGETGAGKSIIIDALGAVIGARTSRQLVRAGAAKGRVSAVFTGLSPQVKETLEELGFSCEDEQLSIQRELSADGKGLCRINYQPATVAALRQLAPLLLDIHGQHDGQQLLQDDKHIDFLDRYCKLEQKVEQCRQQYGQLLACKRRIKALDAQAAEKDARLAVLKQQVEEIAAAALTEGEEERLLEQKRRMDAGEKLLSALQGAIDALTGDEDVPGGAELLDQAAARLALAAGLTGSLKEISDQAGELSALAENLLADVIHERNALDFSPQEQEKVEARLSVLYQLKEKYGSTISDVVAFGQKAAEEIARWEQSDETREEENRQYRALLEQTKALALELSRERSRGAQALQEDIQQRLRQLDMPRARFEIVVERQSVLGAKGMDQVRFAFSANPGQPLQPLTRVASGGELSRVMLALKNALAEGDPVGTVVFDEIDAGVSGRAAQRIAQQLCQAAGARQVLCITHLPQIAAMADHQYEIEKQQQDDQTYTRVHVLDNRERVRQVARLISGDEISSAALDNAADLLQSAQEYKIQIRGGADENI